MLAKIKGFVNNNRTDIVLFIGVVLIALLAFLTGYITAKQQEKAPLIIEDPTYGENQ